MATTIESLSSEIRSIFEAVQEYSENTGAYVLNPSANPYPQFDENKLNIDTLLREAKNNKDSAVDLTSGAVNSMIFKVAGISRELGLRSLTKAMMYDSAIDRAAVEAEEARGTSGRRLSELKGTTPEQSSGV